MKTTKFIFSLLFIFTVIITSCEKAEDGNEVVSTKAIQNEAVSDILWNTIDADVDFVTDLMKSEGFKSVTDTCPMVIVEHADSVYWPRTVTIDYGDGCETWHGRIKKGKIVISVSSPMHIEGSVRTVNLMDYYINDHHIEGTKTLTNKGFNDSGNMNWDVVLTGGTITFPDGAVTSREMSHNREWTSGIETPRYFWDDEWLITGTANGNNIDGVVYNNTIATPVLVKSVCRFPVSGTIDMVITDLGTLVLDYGDGECDNEATVTFGDRVWTIQL
jgi:hypothetical protein